MTHPTTYPGPGVLARNAYFSGKVMTAKDFAADTEYLLTLHRLHNMTCHGWGIVEGLSVEPVPDCPLGTVKVQPGVAITRQGCDLVLDGPVVTTLTGQGAWLYAEYKPVPEDLAQPLSTAQATARPQPNRWVDRVHLGWAESESTVPPAGVALARVAVTGRECVVSGRPPFRGRHRADTRVIAVNWEHGAVSYPGTSLEIEFDRPLHATNHNISPHTFLVHHAADPDEARTRVRGVPAWDPGTRKASHPLEDLRPGWVYVTLLCDFVLDEHGKPVDGNHLGGRLPSGNGAPGGAFESWFRIPEFGGAG